MVDLSIITATIPERRTTLNFLTRKLEQYEGQVEHVVVPGDGTVGRKINAGFQRAKGRYVCVLDDDDWVATDYVASILNAIEYKPDVVTFGVQKGDEVYWLRADTDVDHGDVRMANHLCAWKREIALSVPCLPRNYGWDVVWYNCVRLSGLVHDAHFVRRVLYFYQFSREGTRAQSPASIADSLDNNGRLIRIVRLHDGRIAAGPSLDRMWVANMEMIQIQPEDCQVLKVVEFT